MNPAITFTGTGSAFPESSYNSCFLLRDSNTELLVDAGGGNGILERLSAAGTAPESIRHFIVTHTHTDHILGAVWILREKAQRMRAGMESRVLHFYGNTEVIRTLKTICRLTLHKADYDRIEKIVVFHTVDDGTAMDISGNRIVFFDVKSENAVQTGFRISLSNGIELAVLGDESLTQRNIHNVRGADWLVCGAFCRYADRQIYQPYEKHHWTVADVARLADSIALPNLILVHCEDHTLPQRRELYTAEAAQLFKGSIFVPVDGDTITLTDR